ncbi:hypothetical protein LOC68_02215 [Blastopirellula sp. JC732]|uniref:MoxR-vWA-beta-propeller ternary system domain-containing protein n=1 Tax=Blastopirellula sediminis TaxID=2894196 RepID=A0A9X1MJ17_9BACT|nr:hypothetical protein [Blastopirellula sediminis]MCC9607995.1 hypothetical protein [Blastopirellula sediminis]MCC9627212.1 hypothetical protein [Blastopirellula sediminis]
MKFGSFLIQLFAEGDVAFPPLGAMTERELLEGDAVLTEHEALWRLDQPAPTPSFDLTAGRWGAVRLFRACQFVLYREADAAAIEEELAPPYPGPLTPAVCYSVDLTFRYLPQLINFARSASPDDPLVARLQIWGAEWPLSSVGMANLEELPIDVLIDHPGLRRQYVDRIIAIGDLARLDDPRVQAAIGQALGMYPELAPRIAQKIPAFTTPT